MSTIQLDVSEIQSLKKRISKMMDEVDDCYREVDKLSTQIDMKVKRKKDIDDDLLQIKNDLKKQKEFLSQCERLIGESINEFVDAEKIDRLPELSFSVRSVGGDSNNVGNKGFSDLLLGTGLLTTAGITGLFSKNGGLFSSVNLSDYKDISDYINSKWSDVKNTKKIASFTKEISSIVDGLGGSTPEWIKDITGSDFFKGVGYVSDAEKLIKATTEQDIEGLGDLLGKYGVKEPLKELVKLGGESGAGASLVADCALQRIKSSGEIVGETVTDIYTVLSNPESDWKDYAKCVKSLYTMGNKIESDTAWNIIGSKADTMTDILDFVGVSDYGKQFEEYTGKAGANIIDFYETVGSDIKGMYNTLGFEDTTKILAKSFCETISDQATDLANTAAGWAESIKGAFNKLA